TFSNAKSCRYRRFFFDGSIVNFILICGVLAIMTRQDAAVLFFWSFSEINFRTNMMKMTISGEDLQKIFRPCKTGPEKNQIFMVLLWTRDCDSLKRNSTYQT